MTETEPTVVWRRSRYCESAECEAVAPTAGYVSIRDSRGPDRLVLRFSAAEWAVFVAGVRAGEYDC